MYINETNENEIKTVENKTLVQTVYEGERALFKGKNLLIKECTFQNGESPLKESENIVLEDCIFAWKYPIWYSKHIKIKNSTFLETSRSGIWYTEDIEIVDSSIVSPKQFRRTKKIKLVNCSIPNASEILWNCEDIKMHHVSACGDYLGFNSKNIFIDHFELNGNYVFDGASNVEIHNSKLIAKDAFWNCENVVVYDSTIIGEYLGWNSKNVTFINCIIESDQGLCYMDNVKLIDCKLCNTKLAFEYVSNLEAKIKGEIDSIKNPISGTIKVQKVNEIIMDSTKINPNKTKIIVGEEE